LPLRHARRQNLELSLTCPDPGTAPTRSGLFVWGDARRSFEALRGQSGRESIRYISAVPSRWISLLLVLTREISQVRKIKRYKIRLGDGWPILHFVLDTAAVHHRHKNVKVRIHILFLSNLESLKEMTLASPRLLVSLSIPALSLLSRAHSEMPRKICMEALHHVKRLNRLVNSNI